MPPTDLMTRLRTETRGPHDQIEALPFHQNLARGALHRDEYHALLEVLLMIHTTQEELRASAPRRIQELSAPLLRLSPFLEADCQDARDLGTHPTCSAPEVQARRYLNALRFQVVQTPLVLLGHLYVLHGSLLGGLQLRPLFVEALNWPPEKMRYFGGLGPQVPAAWRQFREQMNQAAFSPADEDRIVTAATDAFEELIHIYAAFPIEEQPANSLQVAS